MSLEVFGDGGDGEDLVDAAAHYGYELCSDDRWRETMDEEGKTDEQMWEYIMDRRDQEEEDLATGQLDW